MSGRQPVMMRVTVLVVVVVVMRGGHSDGFGADATAGTEASVGQMSAAGFSAAGTASAPRLVKRSDDLAAWELLLQQHSQQLSQLAAEMTALKAKLGHAQTNVAFQARKSQDPFPVAKGAPIVFDVVLTNINNAYDDHTGFFTAPVSGTYAFHVSCMAVGSSSFAVSVVVSDVIVTQCWSTSSGSSELGSSDVSVHVGQGQKVWTKAEYSENVRGVFWTTFGGHLVRADDL